MAKGIPPGDIEEIGRPAQTGGSPVLDANEKLEIEAPGGHETTGEIHVLDDVGNADTKTVPPHSDPDMQLVLNVSASAHRDIPDDISSDGKEDRLDVDFDDGKDAKLTSHKPVYKGSSSGLGHQPNSGKDSGLRQVSRSKDHVKRAALLPGYRRLGKKSGIDIDKDRSRSRSRDALKSKDLGKVKKPPPSKSRRGKKAAKKDEEC